MSADVEVDGLRPGKVRNKTTTAKKFAVVVEWDPPNAWEDGSTSGFDLATAVSHYEVDLISGGSVVAQDLHVVRTKVRFDRDVGTGPYSSKVRVIGHDMEYATEDAAAGSATPEGVGFGEVTGTITKPQMGTLGISRYGTTAAMNAASAVHGDIWINTDYSPARVFRYESGAWQSAVDGSVLISGTVIADAVVAGAIDGHTITGVFITGSTVTGGTLRTASAGARVEITGSRSTEVVFYDGLAERAALSGAVNNGNKLKVSTGLWAVSASQFDSAVDILSNLTADGLVIGTNAGTPPTGYLRLYKETTTLKVKSPSGAVVTLATGLT